MTSSRVLGAAALGAALLLAGAACGSNGGGSPSTSEPTGTPTSPTTASSSPSASARGDASALLTKLSDDMLAEGSGRFEIHTSAETMTGAFSTHGSQLAMDATMDLPAAHITGMRFLVAGGSFYVASDQLLGAGKFAQIDPADPGGLGSIARALPGMRPGASFGQVVPAVKGIHDLGQARIDGQPTEHYRLDIDSLKAHSLINPGTEVPDSVTSKVPKTFEYDLYVIDDALVRRVQFEVLGKGTTIDYTDWGTDVRISTPPASSVVPLPTQ